ncbi:PREDICTED: uncharacterized protein LOC109149935 [Ipomoea nil]|uniref:uncharacterized protein LOC109149935 n=1 Tax=Ipomoea nil TaxID=35883 RepID=UPI000901C713|nr:PREDICTED: uncharacterized protein LOC109149935 [Ipomoea nil]
MASAGGLVRDHNGSWDVGFITKIEITSSFINGGTLGIEGWALALRIIIETDSESTVNAVKSEGGARPEAGTLIQDSKNIREQIKDWDFIHTLIEGNQCADFLVNLAKNSDWGTYSTQIGT